MNESTAAQHVSAAYGSAMRADPATQAQMKAYALQFLPIVKSEVLRFKMRVPRHIEFEELHGVAICGLMRAFERFTRDENPEQFGGYVRKRVRGAILDELRRLDTMSRGARQKARRYDQVVLEIEQREGRIATEAEIMHELGLDAAAFDKLLDELRPVTFFSLDDVDAGEGEGGLLDFIQDVDAPRASDSTEVQELMQIVRERLGQLPVKQRKILHMYYFKEYRLAEIAEAFGLSEGRISQLHTQAIRSLKVAFRAHVEDGDV